MNEWKQKRDSETSLVAMNQSMTQSSNDYKSLQSFVHCSLLCKWTFIILCAWLKWTEHMHPVLHLAGTSSCSIWYFWYVVYIFLVFAFANTISFTEAAAQAKEEEKCCNGTSKAPTTMNDEIDLKRRN